jgi:hypothetical protein
VQCATHPNVETELACSRCGKPICPRCMVQTPVGARCRECAQVRRLPTYNIAPTTFGRAIAGAVGGAVALGLAWGFFNAITALFYGFVAGIAIGYAMGEIVSLATNRRAGPPLQAIAVAGLVLAYVVRLGVLYAFGDWSLHDLRTDAIGLIVLVVAALVAAGRVR